MRRGEALGLGTAAHTERSIFWSGVLTRLASGILSLPLGLHRGCSLAVPSCACRGERWARAASPGS